MDIIRGQESPLAVISLADFLRYVNLKVVKQLMAENI